jgi:hypothetical protein
MLPGGCYRGTSRRTPRRERESAVVLFPSERKQRSGKSTATIARVEVKSTQASPAQRTQRLLCGPLTVVAAAGLRRRSVPGSRLIPSLAIVTLRWAPNGGV